MESEEKTGFSHEISMNQRVSIIIENSYKLSKYFYKNVMEISSFQDHGPGNYF